VGGRGDDANGDEIKPVAVEFKDWGVLTDVEWRGWDGAESEIRNDKIRETETNHSGSHRDLDVPGKLWDGREINSGRKSEKTQKIQ